MGILHHRRYDGVWVFNLLLRRVPGADRFPDQALRANSEKVRFFPLLRLPRWALVLQRPATRLPRSELDTPGPPEAAPYANTPPLPPATHRNLESWVLRTGGSESARLLTGKNPREPGNRTRRSSASGCRHSCQGEKPQGTAVSGFPGRLVCEAPLPYTSSRRRSDEPWSWLVTQ